MYGADRERAGMRVSELTCAADGDPDHDRRSAWRRERDCAGGKLFTAGERRQVFSDWSRALYPRKCLGDRESPGRLGCRGAECCCSKLGQQQYGEFSEVDGEQESLAVQSFLRGRRSSSWAEVKVPAGSKLRFRRRSDAASYVSMRTNRVGLGFFLLFALPHPSHPLVSRRGARVYG